MRRHNAPKYAPQVNMHIFLMRHGEAVTSTVTDAATDAVRPLTERGASDVLAMVERVGTSLAAIDTIWASPYLRAQQTAALVAKRLHKPVHSVPELVPSVDPAVVLERLSCIEETLLLVGHQPLIGILVDRLAGLEPGRYRMGTAAIANIQGDILAPACGELNWLHQPAFEKC